MATHLPDQKWNPLVRLTPHLACLARRFILTFTVRQSAYLISTFHLQSPFWTWKLMHANKCKAGFTFSNACMCIGRQRGLVLMSSGIFFHNSSYINCTFFFSCVVETNMSSSHPQCFTGSVQPHLLAAWTHYLPSCLGYLWGMWSQTMSISQSKMEANVTPIECVSMDLQHYLTQVQRSLSIYPGGYDCTLFTIIYRMK